MMGDIFFVLQWWFVLFLLGIIFLPFSFFIFQKFSDRGYVFSKIVGILFVSYSVYVLSFFHVLPFRFLSILFVLWIFLVLNVVVFHTLKKGKHRNCLQRFWRMFFSDRWMTILFEESLFLLGIAFWVFVRGHEPTINGLEKFMDFGFMNSILKGEYAPPRDMWFTPFSINYYYFGHYVTAVLTKLSGITSSVSYNLMLASIFAFSLSASFSIGSNIIREKVSEKVRFGAGVMSAVIVSFAGNLHTLYLFFQPYQNENPQPLWELVFSPMTFPNSYWYPNATRFIMNTIHEFPIYSFVVADLHGHVLSIPFVLLTVGLVLSLFIKKSFGVIDVFLMSFLMSILYMTNAMDGVIYFGLMSISLLAVIVRQVIKIESFEKYGLISIFEEGNVSLIFKRFLFYIVILILGFLLFSFPFLHNFESFVKSIGVVCPPKFLVDLGSDTPGIGKFGPFIFEDGNCDRSPWWQLLTLHGYFLYFSAVFIFFLFRRKIFLSFQKLFVVLLIVYSFILIVTPEFLYAKDIYPDHYRANTMFKLGYQAFIMLSFVSAYVFVGILAKRKRSVFFIAGLLLTVLVLLYPSFAIQSYYGSLKSYKGIDGVEYMKTRLPDDFSTIQYIRSNISGQPVVLEAQGGSYTDFGRISVHTGLPTVLGWEVHEWLWRGSYDIPAPRIEEVRQMYESNDVSLTKKLLEKYDVEYVYVGDLEREKYPQLFEGKFSELGTVIYRSGESRLYHITN